MPAAPFWETTPDPWDTLVLGGHTLPGLTSVSGRAGRKMDVRPVPGGDGARVRDRGYEPAQLEARNRVWTDEQLEALQTILEALHPRRVNNATGATRGSARTQRELSESIQRAALEPTLLTEDKEFRDRHTVLQRRAEEQQRRAAAGAAAPSRTPVDAVHPSLSMLGIRSVYVTGVSVPVIERGEMVTTISLIEWTAVPAPAPRPANGSQGLESIETSFDRQRDSLEPTATPPSRLPKTALAK